MLHYIQSQCYKGTPNYSISVSEAGDNWTGHLLKVETVEIVLGDQFNENRDKFRSLRRGAYSATPILGARPTADGKSDRCALCDQY